MATMSTFGQGIARGMKVTLEHFFKPKITVQYPEEKIALAPRFRGARLEESGGMWGGTKAEFSRR